MSRIEHFESQIIGKWRMERGKAVADKNCQRIDDLTVNYLIYVKSSDDGWGKLFQDPNDGRFWELSYPHSEWHGGGPPLLTNISAEEAKKRYGQLA